MLEVRNFTLECNLLHRCFLYFLCIVQFFCSNTISYFQVGFAKIQREPNQNEYPYLTQNISNIEGLEILNLTFPINRYESLANGLYFDTSSKHFHLVFAGEIIFFDEYGNVIPRERKIVDSKNQKKVVRLKSHKEMILGSVKQSRHFDYLNPNESISLIKYIPKTVSVLREGYNGSQGTWPGTIGKGYFHIRHSLGFIPFQFDHVCFVSHRDESYYDTELEVYRTKNQVMIEKDLVIVMVPGNRYYERWLGVDYKPDRDERGSAILIRPKL